jgi:transposase
VGKAIEPVSRSKTGSIDLVQLRDVLSAVASHGQSEPLLEVALGLLTQCKEVIEGQAYEIALLRKQLFGRRSERVSPDQLHLFGALLEGLTSQMASTQEPEGALASEKTEGKQKKRRAPQRRRPLVPTKTVEVPVPEETRACPSCGQERHTIGHERSLVIEYTPPKLDVIEFLREKVACKPCEGEISLAPQPPEKVVERAAPGPGLLAALAVQKHVDGLPLHRSRRIFARAGLSIAVQTLNRWEGYAQELGQPLTRRIRDGTVQADTINLDDTGLRVRDRSGEHGAWRGHIWVFVGRSYDPEGDLTKTIELVSYLYAPTWEARYPEAFLHSFKGGLQGDAYTGYDRIAGTERAEVKNLLAGCMMHARRPFTRAHEMGDPLAVPFVEGIRELYRIERQAKESGLRAGERLALRQAESLPVLEQLRSRAADLSPLPLGKPLREGVRYLENQWEKLCVPFTQDGRLEIDNGAAERRLRRLASGRRAWLFAGSESGAHRIADMLSLVATADAAGLDPGAYLTDVFRRIAAGWPQRHLDDLLPHRWRTLEEREQ